MICTPQRLKSDEFQEYEMGGARVGTAEMHIVLFKHT